MKSDFAGRTAIVTGAAHGFGRAISLAFAERGAAVWACDVIEDELILALPLVPTRPGAPLEHIEMADDEMQPAHNNPFAALASLKKH